MTCSGSLGVKVELISKEPRQQEFCQIVTFKNISVKEKTYVLVRWNAVVALPLSLLVKHDLLDCAIVLPTTPLPLLPGTKPWYPGPTNDFPCG